MWWRGAVTGGGWRGGVRRHVRADHLCEGLVEVELPLRRHLPRGDVGKGRAAEHGAAAPGMAEGGQHRLFLGRWGLYSDAGR